MKTIFGLLVIASLFGGCVRKSELEKAQQDLAAARQSIETLKQERVPRSEFDNARSAAVAAENKLAALENELKNAQAQLAAQEKLELEHQWAQRIATSAESPKPPGLLRGSFEASNGTHVYSPDAVLNFGPELQVSSSTGLMVSDPEQKVVGGELNIIAKDLVLEMTDGLLMAQQDGSVTLTANTLTLKAAGKKPEPQNQPNQP